MGDGKNGYTPPADYRAPDFVRQWSDSASRGADRIEQEREQRTRDAERDAAQRALDGQRAVGQSAQDAQRTAEQAARDAERNAQQLARDTERSTTSTAARATYDLDRSGEGAQRGLAYSHGSAGDALRRSQAPALSPAPVPAAVPAARAPASTPTGAKASARASASAPAAKVGKHTPTATAKNAANNARPGLKPSFAVLMGAVAVITSFMGLWIVVLFTLIAGLQLLGRGFRSGVKGVLTSLLASLLFVAAIGIQLAPMLADLLGEEGASQAEVTVPSEETSDDVEEPSSDVLEVGSSVTGVGDAVLLLALPEDDGALAVLSITDLGGGLSFGEGSPEASPDGQVGFSYVPTDPSGPHHYLINREGYFAQLMGDDPTSVATDHLVIESTGAWVAEILSVGSLPSFDTSMQGMGSGLFLYTGQGGEATFTLATEGRVEVATYGTTPDIMTMQAAGSQVMDFPAGPTVVHVMDGVGVRGTPYAWDIQVAPPGV